jgi:hypothetical protein
MNPVQTDLGRAFKYGIAESLSGLLSAELNPNVYSERSRYCFERVPPTEQSRIRSASIEIVAFLAANDTRLSDKGCSIRLQSDQLAGDGDGRDIIVSNSSLKEDVGISAKHHHAAIKHSRLSESIDFGLEWLGIPCSPTYFRTVVPLFQNLRERASRKERWENISDKRAEYYIPILRAFKTEVLSLFDEHPSTVPNSLLKYLLGKFDFYQVIKENGNVSITSYNIYGTLRWGTRLPMPTRIIEVRPKPRSETTLVVTFDRGWQATFRIHNANALVEPSLKFDINIIETPGLSISREVIRYRP